MSIVHVRRRGAARGFGILPVDVASVCLASRLEVDRLLNP